MWPLIYVDDGKLFRIRIWNKKKVNCVMMMYLLVV